MKILITGFDPFGEDRINPSSEVLALLPKEIAGATIVTHELPTVFGESAKRLKQCIRKELPDAVLCIGQAGGRVGLTPERVAINQDDARIPDNQGQQPIDTSIQPDGQAAYFSTLPIKAMVKAIQDIGLSAAVSNTAGTFVCNHIMYQALYMAEKEFPQMKAGFMHIPYLPEQVVDKREVPSLELVDMVRGVEAAVRAIVAYFEKGDLKRIGGEIH